MSKQFVVQEVASGLFLQEAEVENSLRIAGLVQESHKFLTFVEHHVSNTAKRQAEKFIKDFVGKFAEAYSDFESGSAMLEYYTMEQWRGRSGVRLEFAEKSAGSGGLWEMRMVQVSPVPGKSGEVATKVILREMV